MADEKKRKAGEEEAPETPPGVKETEPGVEEAYLIDDEAEIEVKDNPQSTWGAPKPYIEAWEEENPPEKATEEGGEEKVAAPKKDTKKK